jgi:hypothetical protein
MTPAGGPTTSGSIASGVQKACVGTIARRSARCVASPGSPWQSAWIESFNGRLRDELLNGQRFDSLLEAKVLLEDWRIDYNINRPHSAHGWLTPVEFVEAWLHRQQLTLASRVDQQSGSLNRRQFLGAFALVSPATWPLGHLCTSPRSFADPSQSVVRNLAHCRRPRGSLEGHRISRTASPLRQHSHSSGGEREGRAGAPGSYFSDHDA